MIPEYLLKFIKTTYHVITPRSFIVQLPQVAAQSARHDQIMEYMTSSPFMSNYTHIISFGGNGYLGETKTK